jgi:hypothetical protein
MPGPVTSNKYKLDKAPEVKTTYERNFVSKKVDFTTPDDHIIGKYSCFANLS